MSQEVEVADPIIGEMVNNPKLCDFDTIESFLNGWLFEKGIQNVTINGDTITCEMSTFLYNKMLSGERITIPGYKSVTGKSTQKNAVYLEGDRGGKITSVISNQKTFRFSVGVKDETVVEVGQSGMNYAPRSFSLTEMDGDISDTWQKLVFDMTDGDRRLFAQVPGGVKKIVFDQFVNSSKWICFYGANYARSKVAIEKLTTELKVLKQIKSKFNTINSIISNVPVANKVERTREVQKDKVIVDSFEVIMELPETAPMFDLDEKIVFANLKCETVKDFMSIINERFTKTDAYLKKLRFITRAIEFAFAKMHTKERVENLDFSYPAWFADAQKFHTFKYPGKRIEWRRLCLADGPTGSISLNVRWTTTSQGATFEEVSE